MRLDVRDLIISSSRPHITDLIVSFLLFFTSAQSSSPHIFIHSIPISPLHSSASSIPSPCLYLHPPGALDLLPVRLQEPMMRHSLCLMWPDDQWVSVLTWTGMHSCLFIIKLPSSRSFSFPSPHAFLIWCSSSSALIRLGQRVIQMQQGPMILTGFSGMSYGSPC